MSYRKYKIFALLFIIVFSCENTDKSLAKQVFPFRKVTRISDTSTYKNKSVSKNDNVKNDIVISQKFDIVKQEFKTKSYFITRNLLDNRLSMSLPNNFTIMDDGVVRLKYPRLTKSSIVYSNSKSTVSIAIGLTEHQSTQAHLPEIKKTLDEQYSKSLVQIISSSIEKINGIDFIKMEFMSSAVDGAIYNLMFITSVENRLIVGTFNCTEPLRNEWESKGKKMINSVKFL